MRRCDYVAVSARLDNTLQFPGVGAWPLPMYICWFSIQGRLKEFFISGMFIAGMAGMISVTVTEHLGWACRPHLSG